MGTAALKDLIVVPSILRVGVLTGTRCLVEIISYLPSTLDKRTADV